MIFPSRHCPGDRSAKMRRQPAPRRPLARQLERHEHEPFPASAARLPEPAARPQSPPETPPTYLRWQKNLPEKRFGFSPEKEPGDRKSTRLNSSHGYISYAVFCLKKKTK